MDSNLATQGYCLRQEESRALWLGLRFSTGVCLLLTAGALIAGSVAAFVGLAAIGALAGSGPRHPFDYLWNGAVRHVFDRAVRSAEPGAAPARFKVATAW